MPPHAACGRGLRRRLPSCRLLDVSDEGFGGEHEAAIEAAFCSARRVTLAGSMTPIFTMSPYSPVSALKPKFSSLESRTLPITNGAFVAGVESNLAGRLFESAAHDACTNGFVIVEPELLDRGDAAEQRRAGRRGRYLPRQPRGWRA